MLRIMRPLYLISIAITLIPASLYSADAIQTTGEPGSPSATTTISGQQLPAPSQPFKGKIELNASQSKAYWPARIVPPKDAPNVLLIMTDDVGFGAPSTFGGVIPTPTLDKIANMGLRYTQFNSTALCSPTRAALITGRNHHSAGFGVVSEQSTGFPGYDSIITRDKTTIGRILKDNGYATSWFGKNHNTPTFQSSQVGPFDQWPVGMGFDYFYGFVGGDSSQWQPNLYRNTTAIYPYLNNPNWNLVTAMSDDAIEYLNRITAINSEQPFFIYYVPGATHAPHHPTPEWIKKITDLHLFDKGWNALRDEIFANQKRLGVIPKDAQLTPWPDDLLKRWDKLSADEQKLFIRQANVYAAYLAYADHEIGRVLDKIEQMGKLDNTLIIYISGDNGASAEGSLNGTPNEIAIFNGVDVPVKTQLEAFYDIWGTDKTYPHMAVPWAWAFSTPFSWTKQVASHFGGTRQGVAIAWPKVITDKGGVRNQFHHVIDIVPTILEATGIEAPKAVDGIDQKPIEGVSMVYTFDAKNAKAPSHHQTQYFEMMGDHAIYHDGWIASTKVMRAPWDVYGAVSQDPSNFPFELYHIDNDWTQFENVADKYPEKLKELKELFWKEAKKYQVLPLDASVATRIAQPRPSLAEGRTQFDWTGTVTGTPNGVAPSILNSSYHFVADIEIPDNADGMIVTQGGRFAGYGFYLVKGKPVFLWNMFGLERIRWEAPAALTAGKHRIEFEFKYDGLGAGTLAFNNMSGIGRAGTGVLRVDGKDVATQKMEHTIPIILQFDENFDIGADTGTPVSEEYVLPYNFSGKINKLSLTIDRPALTPKDIQELTVKGQRNNAMSE